MSLTSNYQALSGSISEYRTRLSVYTEDQFIMKPADNVWSAAEVYAHIMTANIFSLKAMKKIADKAVEESNESLPLVSKLILFAGKIPNGRKVPAVVEARTFKVNNKEYALILIDQFENGLKEVWESRNTWSDQYKIKHPVLGALTNPQWIRFMQIHNTHHLKQLDRIAISLNFK